MKCLLILVILIGLGWATRIEARRADSLSSGLSVWYTEEIQQPHYDSNGNPCLGEDSHQDRGWTGDLAPGESFSVTSLQCDGGQGLFYWAKGPISLSLSLNVQANGYGGQGWPEGDYPAHDPTQAKHNVWQRSRCLVPGYMDANTQVMQSPFLIGLYTITVTNTGATTARNVYLRIYSDMAGLAWQMAYCDQQDWNWQ